MPPNDYTWTYDSGDTSDTYYTISTSSGIIINQGGSWSVGYRDVSVETPSPNKLGPNKLGNFERREDTP